MKLTLTFLSFLVTIISFGQIPCGTPDNYETVCESNLPFLWNGEFYSDAGTYTQTITNPGDCDCVYTLYLTVLSTETSQETVAICQGDLPFVWNNESYTTSGTYIDTLQNVNGCDSIATLFLTVTPTFTETTNVTVCEGNLPYLWNNESYSASGLYYDSTFTIGEGCDSVNILNLFVIPFPNFNLNDTAICPGNYVTLLAGNSSLSCDLADPICIDGVTTYPNQINTAAPEGNNYGCLSEQPNPSWFYLTIDQGGSLDFTVSQSIVSGSGQDVDFILYGPYSSYDEVQSYCGNLGTETTGSSVNTIVSCSFSGNEIETVTAETVQDGEVYVLMVTNFSNGIGNYTFTPGNGTATIDCSVVSDNSTSYLWSSGDTTSYIIAEPFETTNYTVTVSQGSCPEVVETATVSILPLPEVTLTDQTILTGEVAVLNAVVSPEGGTYLWLETGETTASISVSPTFNSSYTLEYTYNGCSTLAYVNVIVGDASITEMKAENVNIYPNPASEQLTITTSNFLQSAVYIYSMDGKLVATHKMNGSALNIDVSTLTKGMYTLAIGGKTSLFVKD